MTISRLTHRPLTEEELRLHALIEKRNKRAVKAVEYMLAHPLSWEEIDKQIARNTEHLTADEIRRREQAMIEFYRLLEEKKSFCS
jgi:hypothetical protein